MYARTDLARGVWHSPAGEDADLRGVLGPAVELRVDEVSELAEAGINSIRRLPSGTVVWGARTLAADAEWKYVNVRRLLVYVERSLERGTQWAVFEPNDERLWTKLRAQCASFLFALFRAGALPGTTQPEAYFVQCGPDTMTQSDIENGRLSILVGVAPLRPAEFVIIRIAHVLASHA
jgi:phage tail sheath protein FI